MWQVNVLTLFPEMFPGFLNYSIAKKACEKNIWKLKAINIRDFALDKNKKVDEKIFGGGEGLLLRPDVLGRAIESCYTPSSKHELIYLTPKGKTFQQDMAYELITKSELTIICGRYEGIDERIITRYNPTQISIGDFILSGGEAAALTMLDACIRLLPTVMKSEAALNETFAHTGDFKNLVECPHYTCPREWDGINVPDVLLSGNHEKIRKWRIEQAQKNTKVCRPDLWDKYLSNLDSTNAKSKIKGE